MATGAKVAGDQMAILAALPLLCLGRHSTSFTGSKGRVGGCISIGAGGIPHQKLAIFPGCYGTLLLYWAPAYLHDNLHILQEVNIKTL